MSAPTRITDDVRIAGYVVETKNMRHLADFIYNEHRRDLSNLVAKKREFKSEVEFTLISASGRRYESNDIAIIGDGGILERKRIVEFEMSYEDAEEGKSILLRLEHAPGSLRGTGATVSGWDENWVDGIVHGVEDRVKEWKRQAGWPYNSWMWLFILPPGIGTSLLVTSFSVLGPLRLGESDILLFLHGLNFLVGFVPGAMFGYLMLSKVRQLYPRVELLTGPEHAQEEKQRRRKLYLLVTLVIVPFLVGVLLELVKVISNIGKAG
jgi:hypothetical protein